MGKIRWNLNYQTHQNNTIVTYEQDGKMYNNQGFEIDAKGKIVEGPDEPKSNLDPDVSLESMKVTELRPLARRDPDIKGVSRMAKAELIKIILDYEEIDE